MAKKSLKIAFLSFYSGEVYRGVETFVHELANRLTRAGHAVIVFQNGRRLTGSEYETASIGIPTDYDRKNPATSFIFNYYALRIKDFTQRVLKLLDKDADIVFPTNGQWQSILCRFWTLQSKKKMVLVGQSGPGLDDRINLWTFPDAFVGLTRFQTNWAKCVNPFVKVATIPNGVDLAKFSTKTKGIDFGLPRPIILCVAALIFWKRLDLAINAVSGLAKGSLLLVGRGDKEKELQQLGDKLLPGRFKIASFPHDQMPAVYASADLFTFPTVPWESFGIAMVEAMASGLPVVASDDSIRREVVGDGGLFVNPEDTERYTKTLEKALEADWGDRPRKQAEKFSWDDIAKEYEKLFMDLIQK